jgi:hypothetical protein
MCPRRDLGRASRGAQMIRLATGLAQRQRHDLRRTGVGLFGSGARRSERDRGASWAFVYDRYGHLFPEVDGGSRRGSKSSETSEHSSARRSIDDTYTLGVFSEV